MKRRWKLRGDSLELLVRRYGLLALHVFPINHLPRVRSPAGGMGRDSATTGSSRGQSCEYSSQAHPTAVPGLGVRRTRLAAGSLPAGSPAAHLVRTSTVAETVAEFSGFVKLCNQIAAKQIASSTEQSGVNKEKLPFVRT